MIWLYVRDDDDDDDDEEEEEEEEEEDDDEDDKEKDSKGLTSFLAFFQPSQDNHK